MKFRIKSGKDAGAGLTFLAIGLFAATHAEDYDMGTAFNMGPGYFPRMLGLLLICLGLANCVRSIAFSKQDSIGSFALLPLIMVPLGVLCFGILIENAGLGLAIITLVVLSRLGSREFNLGEVFIICTVLTVLAGILFVYGLQLPASALLPI